MNDFRWLIEAPGPRYLGVRHLTGASMYDFQWTPDYNAALFFKSQEQADLTMMAVRQLANDAPRDSAFGLLFAFESSLGNAKAIEHGWMEPPGPVDPPGPIPMRVA